MSTPRHGSSFVSDFQWVKSARSHDEARPVLTGVFVTDKLMAATDGRALHVTPNRNAVRPGLYNVDEIGLLDGTFPNFAQVVKPGDEVAKKGLELVDLDELVLDCKGSAAAARATHPMRFGLAIPTVAELSSGQRYAFVDPELLFRLVCGFVTDRRSGRRSTSSRRSQPVYVWAPDPLQAIHFFDSQLERQATLMPVRLAVETTPAPRSLARYLKEKS